MDEFNHISFFSGKGGFDLAAEWMGWNNIAHCEINLFLQTLLKYYWPNAITYGNIKETDFSVHRGNIDIVTGGFPCQPYSISGKRKGKDDERHLWPEMRRGIREIQPPWVVGENVRGLLNWNGGLVFDEVQADLEAEGYEVFPFLLPASGVGAPHERYRIWFIAYSDVFRQSRNKTRQEILKPEQRRQAFGIVDGNGSKGNAAKPDSSRLRKEIDRIRDTKFFDKNSKERNWRNFPTQSPVCFGNDGLPTKLDIDAIFNGKIPKRTNAHVKWRNESLQASGNAVVPQLVFQIYKAIEFYNKSIF
ncbi:DNA cytosine methyltransferase [Flavobacterium sp. WW92]|uniref:DNA cytosine methyltransferase n=1 Tax=unclassified Flavobacterium TaxID=196869 RepID=UPI0022242175|nr:MULTISPECIES: DNA cytosine methyltransferase [unclassified Flavobacterium]WDO13076.1 DNA cytosine methyltransferase [Flavobacterium sp. WW92]